MSTERETLDKMHDALAKLAALVGKSTRPIKCDGSNEITSAVDPMGNPMISELKHKAMLHWSEFLPQKWAALEKADRVDAELNRAAHEAEKKIRMWMDRGARLDEAEEIVLPGLIYLPPESGATGLDEESQAESDEMEEEYQRRMAIELKIMADANLDEDEQWSDRKNPE